MTRPRRRSTALAVGLLCAALGVIRAQTGTARKLKLDTGQEIYEAGCVACHGPDGRGQLPSTLGFEKPDTFPDFTRCDQTTPEDNYAWKSVIRDGGPSRGFSQIMPAFGEALTSEQIDEVIRYLRGFCTERGWPPGDLNLPRPLVTEKAYPENEDVITTAVNVHGAPRVSNAIVHEQRVGMRNHIEITLPVNFEHPQRGLWYGGFGDVRFGWKRLLFSSLSTGSILSVQGEAILPTGHRGHGLGSGVTAFETFAAYGQLLPRRSFIQMQGGAELPADTDTAPRAVFFRAAIGKSIAQNRGLGRLWSPMLEVLAERDLVTGARTNWDLIPELQVTISRRQHVRANLGLRIPATNTAGRSMQLVFYLLWDRQDGRLVEGW